ncbi:MAG TPA: nuclear transport factor 2 family protein [Actinomycetota bacterium]|nr:nuclear transport factor 2 family protein [Actinomycetota bacterium]
MSGADLVRRLFERLEARDWEGARATLEDDASVEWPHSGERYPSADAFIGMQRAYPEGWHIEIVRVVEDPPVVVAEVRVTQEPEVFHCVGIYEVPGDRIAGGTEYWVTAGAEEPPEWRRRFTEP